MPGTRFAFRRGVQARYFAILFGFAVTAGFADAPATIVGNVMFVDGASPTRQTGDIEMTVRGTGDIGGKCPDAGTGQFVAIYRGVLEIAGDGDFRASLEPFVAPSTPS